MASVKNPPAPKTDISKLKIGERLSEINYYTVTGFGKRNGQDVVKVTDKNGLEVGVSYALIENCYNSSQYTKTEKVTQTQLAELLIGAGDAVFTVCFIKKNKEERILTGHYVKHEAIFGRSQVVDLEISSGHRMRLVTHATMQWLILKGTKYVLK